MPHKNDVNTSIAGPNKPVEIPRVAVIDRSKMGSKRQPTAGSTSSGTSGAEIEVQVGEDDAPELQSNNDGDYRKSELQRAITKVLNMPHQPVQVSDMMNIQSPTSELPTGLASSDIRSTGMNTVDQSVNRPCLNDQVPGSQNFSIGNTAYVGVQSPGFSSSPSSPTG